MGTVPLFHRVTQAVSGLEKTPKTLWMVSNADSERPLSPCLMSHPGASLFHRAAVSPFHCPTRCLTVFQVTQWCSDRQLRRFLASARGDMLASRRHLCCGR